MNNHPVLFGALIGIGVIFVGLVFVYLLASGHKRMIAEINEKLKKHDEQLMKSSRKFAAQAIEDILKAKEERERAAKSKAQTSKPAASNDNGAVVAAITAAISVMMDGAPFKVKSVKRAQAVQSANAWDIVAIQEQNNNL